MIFLNGGLEDVAAETILSYSGQVFAEDPPWRFKGQA